MQIQSSQLQFSASQHAQQSRVRHADLRLPNAAVPAAAVAAVSGAPQAREAVTANPAAEPEAALETLRSDPQFAALIRLIETLTGRSVRLFDVATLSPEAETTLAETLPTPPPRGLRLEVKETYSEFESLSFSARGEVKTADGRTLQFELQLELQRSYVEQRQLVMQTGPARQRKDPLLIHFDGPAAQLQSQRFRFDLDADGELEDIPRLAAGSGYLLLDRNGNGRVDDGRELFGALSGDGFADLAELDVDGNGWIDAADPALSQLQVWDGAGHVQGLAAYGVAALSLQHLASPFALRDGANAELGQLRSSGLYLREDGRPGLLQQIDLSV